MAWVSRSIVTYSDHPKVEAYAVLRARVDPIILRFDIISGGVQRQPAAVVADADFKPAGAQFIAEAGHSPPFARMPYEAFGRAEAVAIAEQEWRLFGAHVDDDPPAPGGFDPTPGDDPARVPGHWERIGEYWWLGQDVDRRESAWTGMHDENGNEIDTSRDDYYAWSAAFINYVMRTAGAGARFPYSPSYLRNATLRRSSRHRVGSAMPFHCGGLHRWCRASILLHATI